ncbi:uncharacterized protein LOC122535724 [Frieseomelitta varia]|uniref:uncharacterized protein LOC122535724 n=1 Tax=Frieseomelitta varia TaxID=561572 RepID=UPI001CB69F19|nr:uncharacterized protein LOC122535724 [Frieseomelitta varia]
MQAHWPGHLSGRRTSIPRNGKIERAMRSELAANSRCTESSEQAEKGTREYARSELLGEQSASCPALHAFKNRGEDRVRAEREVASTLSRPRRCLGSTFSEVSSNDTRLLCLLFIHILFCHWFAFPNLLRSDLDILRNLGIFRS